MRRITGVVSLVLFLFGGIGSPVLAVDWNPLPDTGQDKCYDMAGGEIVCPEPGNNLHGQDGNYQSVSAYYQPDNGVILDKNTNLMWQQNHKLHNQCSGEPGNYCSWSIARDYCAQLSLQEYNDWRLPTRMELKSILDYSQASPASDPVFKSAYNSQNQSYHCYWSETVDAANETQAWMVCFYNGGDKYVTKTASGIIRCIRP